MLLFFSALSLCFLLLQLLRNAFLLHPNCLELLALHLCLLLVFCILHLFPFSLLGFSDLILNAFQLFFVLLFFGLALAFLLLLGE